jgi:hypothetical protein
MGYILTAVCPSCHFKKENLYYGSGMMEREPKIPAVDQQSGDLAMVEPDLPGYDYYHDPKMYKGDVNDSWMSISALTRIIARNARPSRCALIMSEPGIEVIPHKIVFPCFVYPGISIPAIDCVMPAT